MTAIEQEPGFGRYELLARTGEGPRGPVFIARLAGDGATDDLYMLEVSAFATGEDEALRSFVQNIERTAQIRHRNVVGIVEIGATPAGPYVVTYYIEGCTLTEVQDRHRAIRPPRLVLASVIDALHGLHAAHALRKDGVPQPLIHGSLSSDSLVIATDGTCRVTGFGNARPRVQTKPSHRSKTASGYMAPEQLTIGECDERSDLFSIGVVLWNALTGKKLFHDRIEHMTMSNVLERKIPRPSTIGLAPPPALDAVVMMALDRDPARRFQSAAEMAGALRDVARGAACLASGAEVGEWITATFGGELAARRRALREIADRRRTTGAEPSLLPQLGVPAPAESPPRDELSIDELSRASSAPPAAVVRNSTQLPTPDLYQVPVPRKQLAIVAIASFLLVVVVIGWRWSIASSATEPAAATEPPRPEPVAPPPAPPELEVTVLEVRDVRTATPVPPPEPAKTVAAPEPPARPAPPPAVEVARPQPPAAINRAPARPIKKQPMRPTLAPSRPADAHAEPAEAKSQEPAPEATPPKSDAPTRPALESNPYIYK